jgi:hypothetical protein
MTIGSLDKKSILDGVYLAIDCWLNVDDIGQPPHHRHRLAWKQVGGKPAGSMDGYQLITELLGIIERNWQDAGTGHGKAPSKENWRLVPLPEISKNNASTEVTLERAMVALSPADWANQVPTSSGLCGSTRDKRRAIDLVYKNGLKEYTFFELKIASDTPLFAAMEILIYGILYMFTRQHIDELGYDNGEKVLLGAQTIHLRTLAPRKYYGGVDLTWLDKAINVGLTKYLSEQTEMSLKMDFGFVTIPDEFEWPHNKSELPKIMSRLCKAIS